MLCADESLGRCSKILSDSCAAERSSPSATNGCARSAVAKCCFASVSLSSLAAMVGTRGCVVFTVARCAHPHHPKIDNANARSEEHTSELQSRRDLVCRLLLEK